MVEAFKAVDLLYNYETVVPDKVQQTSSFFVKFNVWYLLARNDEAYSCEDAAKKRFRNNIQGIPLEDELKTYFGEYDDLDGSRQLVLINLPGNCRIDFKKIRSILSVNGKVRLAQRRTMNLFRINFGEVNPFLIYTIFNSANTVSRFSKLTMMFDESLLSKKNTMLTNAGELTWGIEFRISEVIPCFDNVIYNFSFIE